MLRLRDIMTSDVVTLAPEVTIRDAMALLASKHLSGAPVVASGRVLGVVSATDMLDFAAALPGVPTERSDSANPDDGDDTALEPDEDEKEDEAAVAFFVDMWDNAGADVVERMNSVEGPEWDVLQEHTVSEAMTRDLFKLGPDTPVDLAADQMRKSSVHRVLVMQEDELLGIVSTKDIADAVADHKLTTNRYVFSPDAKFDDRPAR
jgi:CBS domain-containing protein